MIHDRRGVRSRYVKTQSIGARIKRARVKRDETPSRENREAVRARTKSARTDQFASRCERDQFISHHTRCARYLPRKISRSDLQLMFSLSPRFLSLSPRFLSGIRFPDSGRASSRSRRASNLPLPRDPLTKRTGGVAIARENISICEFRFGRQSGIQVG